MGRSMNTKASWQALDDDTGPTTVCLLIMDNELIKQKKMAAREIWFLRRMLRISRAAKMTNIQVMQEAKSQRLVTAHIRPENRYFFFML